MATANGVWIPIDIPLPNTQAPNPLPPYPLPPVEPTARKPVGSQSNKSKAQRKHHYTFDIDDNGLDINGFILHHDKHEGKRQKFRVYLDSNVNGRFDKNDFFFGRKGLKIKHSKKGIGAVLGEDDIGQLEVKFKRLKSNASKKTSQNAGNDPNYSVNSMSFNDPASAAVVDVSPPEPSWQECSRFACTVMIDSFAYPGYSYLPSCDACEDFMTNNGCSSYTANQAVTMMRSGSKDASCICG